MSESAIESWSASSIDQVVDRLDTIIQESQRDHKRLGYFAALYREVTVQVKEAIATGYFEDGDRMEHLDVIFANRYLEAFRAFKSGAQPTKSWRLAFDSAASWRFLILQHLLLGINAHINLDLGIAAAQTSPGAELPSLKDDFFRINRILSSLLEAVQDKINALSPGMWLLDRVGGRTDEAIMNFSIERARDAAWDAAEGLAFHSGEDLQTAINRLDERVERFGRFVRSPGFLVNVVAFFIRFFESRNVSRNIHGLL